MLKLLLARGISCTYQLSGGSEYFYHFVFSLDISSITHQIKLVFSLSQFEQPFEDTAALNIWSRDRDQAPGHPLRDLRIREHHLADLLEEAVARNNRKESGKLFNCLANKEEKDLDRNTLDDLQKALVTAARVWKQEMAQIPGGDPYETTTAEDLVAKHLDCIHLNAIDYEKLPEDDWKPGDPWDESHTVKLPRELGERCKIAPESSPFHSICEEK